MRSAAKIAEALRAEAERHPHLRDLLLDAAARLALAQAAETFLETCRLLAARQPANLPEVETKPPYWNRD